MRPSNQTSLMQAVLESTHSLKAILITLGGQGPQGPFCRPGCHRHSLCCDRGLLTVMEKSLSGLLWAMAGTLRDLLCDGCCSSHTVTLASDLFQDITQEPTLLPVLSDQLQLGVHTPPALHSAGSRNPSPSASQREHQALQDLIDLAGEGLSASPWPCSSGPANSEGTEGETLDATPEPALPSSPSLP